MEEITQYKNKPIKINNSTSCLAAYSIFELEQL
jgi:predicted dinucleotide-utilizing enzyme